MSNYDYDPSTQGDTDAKARLKAQLDARRAEAEGGKLSERITRDPDPAPSSEADHSFDPVHMRGGGLVQVSGRDSYLPSGHILTISYRHDPHSRWQGRHTSRVETPFRSPVPGDLAAGQSPPQERIRTHPDPVRTDPNPRNMEPSPSPFGDVPFSGQAVGRFVMDRDA